VTKRQANAIAAQLRRAGSLLEMAEIFPPHTGCQVDPDVILASAELASEAVAKIVADLAKPEG